jgi:hypothetical protein
MSVEVRSNEDDAIGLSAQCRIHHRSWGMLFLVHLPATSLSDLFITTSGPALVGRILAFRHSLA